MIETQKEMAGKKADVQTEKAKALAEIGLNKYREQQKAHQDAEDSTAQSYIAHCSWGSRKAAFAIRPSTAKMTSR